MLKVVNLVRNYLVRKYWTINSIGFTRIYVNRYSAVVRHGMA